MIRDDLITQLRQTCPGSLDVLLRCWQTANYTTYDEVLEELLRGFPHWPEDLDIVEREMIIEIAAGISS